MGVMFDPAYNFLTLSIIKHLEKQQGMLEIIHFRLALKIGPICPGRLNVVLALRQGPDQDDPGRPLPALGFRESMTWPAVWSDDMRVCPVESKRRAKSSASKDRVRVGEVPYGRWGPASQEGKGGALSHLQYFQKRRWGGVGPGREEARVWTFHAIQTQRTRAAEGPRAGRGAGSCFLGRTGSNSALFSVGRSGKLASSWQYWGRAIRAFLLVAGEHTGELREREGRPTLPLAGPS